MPADIDVYKRQVMFSQTLIDGYILPLLNSGSTDFSGLAAAIARVAAFYCVGICAVFVQNRLMAKITQGTLKDLRDEMFTHMQTLPIKYFDTHAHGDIMSVYTCLLYTSGRSRGRSGRCSAGCSNRRSCRAGI